MRCLLVAQLAFGSLMLSSATVAHGHPVASPNAGLPQDAGDLFSWYEDGTVAPASFSIAHRTAHKLGDCGFRDGVKSPFTDNAATDSLPWYDNGQWVSYARESAGHGCSVGEYQRTAGGASTSLCWQDYGFQFFNPSLGGLHPLRVENTSPVIRIIPSTQYPADAAACVFTSDTALIFVAGVGNTGLGSGWVSTAPEQMAALLAWNRNAALPQAVGAELAGHGKLRDLPGYLQIVANDGTPRDGTIGAHNQHGIETLLANFELAYRSGINHLEVVTHSNGMITAQIAYAVFARNMTESFWGDQESWGAGAWNAQLASRLSAAKAAMIQDRKAHGGAEQMQISFYHLQAAPVELTTAAAKDAYGFSGDFVPFLKGDGTSGEYTRYNDQELARLFAVGFRYYYNEPDLFTYGTVSDVGRPTSMKWQEALTNAHVPVVVKHYACKNSGEGVCGPSHDQIKSLHQFTNPAMTDTQKPMVWVSEAP